MRQDFVNIPSMFISRRDQLPERPVHSALNYGTPDEPQGVVYLACGGTVGFGRNALWRTKRTPDLSPATLGYIGAALGKLFPGWKQQGQPELLG